MKVRDRIADRRIAGVHPGNLRSVGVGGDVFIVRGVLAHRGAQVRHMPHKS